MVGTITNKNGPRTEAAKGMKTGMDDQNNNAPRHRNEVTLAGNLVRDPEIKYTTTGKAVANFTLVTGTNPKYKQFHRVCIWEDLVEQIAQLRVGAFVEIHGYLETRSWEKNGEKRYTTQVVGRAIYVGGKKTDAPLTPDPYKTQGGTAIARAVLSPAPKSASNIHGQEITDADVPF